MKKYTAIEWQSFSLKKDVEIIVNKLQADHTIQMSLLCEMALVFLGVALANIIDGIAKKQLFWVILLVLSVIPFLIIGIKKIIKKCKENKPGADQMNIREFINAFDNEIPYYILMSESYYAMFSEALTNKDLHIDEVQKNILHFYYIQASYYFTKAIAGLASLHNIAEKVLSVDIEETASKRLISLPRYYNVRNLLTSIYNYIKSHENIMNNLDEGTLIIALNEKYKKDLKNIDDAVKKGLGL